MKQRIKYRPYCGGYDESMARAQIFNSVEDMIDTIVAKSALKVPNADHLGIFEWHYPFSDKDLFIAEDSFDDFRSNWNDCRYVKSYRYFNEFFPEGCVIGLCCFVDYDFCSDFKDLVKKYFCRRK